MQKNNSNSCNNNASHRIQTASQAASVVVAILALGIAILTDHRSEERLQEQLKQSEKIAVANIRPLLTIRIENTINAANKLVGKEIILENRGIGTAVITKAIASNGLDDAGTIPELLEFSNQYVFDYYFTMGSGQYLGATHKLTLAKMTHESLVKSAKIKPIKALETLQEFDEQLENIVLEIEYEDVMGNLQPSMTRSFGGNNNESTTGLTIQNR